VSAWILWTLGAVALAIGEILTPGLSFLGPVALGAVLAAVAAAVGVPVLLQVVVFLVAATAAVGLLRPIARSHLHLPAPVRTGTAALVGAKCVVLQRVDATGGRVRLGGEEWSARAYLDDQVLEPGARVEVVKIEGATALVVE
jgi:membrane protein implicated in regulation of membrane protease activity